MSEIGNQVVHVRGSVSEPLHQLLQYAPTSEGSYPSIADPGHPISNDALASTFSCLNSRKDSEAFKTTRNRTAILIGESALMASIQYMPEDTIILLDKHPAMVEHMGRYVTALRTAETANDWLESVMGDLSGYNDAPYIRRRVMEVYDGQARSWTNSGHEHPWSSADAFSKAGALAREKALIPWRADISRSQDMTQLGRILKAFNANITMLNLTNVLACEPAFFDSKEVVQKLAPLPVTPDAPIVNTTVADYVTFRHLPHALTHPCKTFFGLDDLSQNGGIVDPDHYNQGPAITKAISL